MILSRESLADLNQFLYNFSLSRIESNAGRPVDAVLREASNNLADLRQFLAASNADSVRRGRAIELRKLSTSLEQITKELADLRPLSSNTLEIKRTPSGVRIKGYANCTGVRDQDGEIFAPGAFGTSLAKHRSGGTAPFMFWGHSGSGAYDELPIGVWTNLSEDSKGLLAVGLLLPSVQQGAEVISLLEAGSPLGLSVGFITLKDQIINKMRVIQEVDLKEISIVPFPASPSTGVQIDVKEYGREGTKSLAVVARDISNFSMARF
jgi:HK97 family phage prohead protease